MILKPLILSLLPFIKSEVPNPLRSANQNVGDATLLDFIFSVVEIDYADLPDDQKDNFDDSVYCNEHDCRKGHCKMTWVYTGNGAFQEITPLIDEPICDKDAAGNYISHYELIENKMTTDDLGQMMLLLENQLMMRKAAIARNGQEPDEGILDTLDELRRFKNLKAMTMTLQPVNVTVFGRYCYYGCWCLPNGMHNLAAGYGTPVDAIDIVCKQFALCYKCLDIDFGGNCNPEARAYRWSRILDSNGIPYDIECKDNHLIGPTHRCKRYTCECDRVLAVGLMHTHWVWNESFHARWGGFDREAYCENGCSAEGPCYPQDDCCGAYGAASTDVAGTLSRRPYATTNVDVGCCQDVYFYDLNLKDCCLDSDGEVKIVDVGACNGAGQLRLDPDEIEDFDKDFPGYTK